MATAPVIPPQEAVPLSQVQRFINTFIAPSKTFRDLNRSASWWFPFLVLIVISVTYVAIVGQQVGFQKAFENQLRTQPKQEARVDSLPPDEKERVIRQQTTLTKVIAYIFPSFWLLGWLIMATVLYCTIRFGASAEVKFKALY